VDIVKGNIGWIEVVAGRCFGQERRVDSALAPRGVCAASACRFSSPRIDERYSANEIVSHPDWVFSRMREQGFGSNGESAAADGSGGIDEAQFWATKCGRVHALANLGQAGDRRGYSDTDYAGRPFEPMPRLLAMAKRYEIAGDLCGAAAIRPCIRTGSWRARN